MFFETTEFVMGRFGQGSIQSTTSLEGATDHVHDKEILGGLAAVSLLVLGSAANAVVINNPVLTYANATFLGTITPGGGSPTTEGRMSISSELWLRVRW